MLDEADPGKPSVSCLRIGQAPQLCSGRGAFKSTALAIQVVIRNALFTPLRGGRQSGRREETTNSKHLLPVGLRSVQIIAFAIAIALANSVSEPVLCNSRIMYGSHNILSIGISLPCPFVCIHLP